MPLGKLTFLHTVINPLQPAFLAKNTFFGHFGDFQAEYWPN